MKQSEHVGELWDAMLQKGLETFGGTKDREGLEMAGVKLRLKKDLNSGAYLGAVGDVFVVDEETAEILLKTKPKVWAKVKVKKPKPALVPDKPVVPGAPIPNKAVKAQDVAQRLAGAPSVTEETSSGA